MENLFRDRIANPSAGFKPNGEPRLARSRRGELEVVARNKRVAEILARPKVERLGEIVGFERTRTNYQGKCPRHGRCKAFIYVRTKGPDARLLSARALLALTERVLDPFLDRPFDRQASLLFDQADNFAGVLNECLEAS